MDDWKNIRIPGIANIRKCVAEFEVHELIKTPYGKFKVKIYEDKHGHFTGYTILQLKDSDGCPFCGVGYGETVNEALKDTIKYFLRMLDEKAEIYKVNLYDKQVDR